MSIRISAIICTLNRAAYLEKAIQSLVHQTLPKEQYEVIVVDNGSTDDTKAVVEGFEHFGNLRYIQEPIIGLSQARNTGWQKAKGEYIAYLDDDAIACKDWLRRILHAFDTAQPRPGSVGGKVIPLWEVERPAWLPPEMENTFAIVDWGDKSKFLTEEHEHNVGCNVAYPLKILQECGGFNTNLGRKGTNLLSNDENLIRSYIRQHNLGIYYDPEICVEHHIPAERLVKRFFYRRLFWQGVSNEILNYLESCRSNSNWRYRLGPIVNISRFIGYLALSLAGLVRSENRDRWFTIQCGCCYRLGQNWGQLQIAAGRVKD